MNTLTVAIVVSCLAASVLANDVKANDNVAVANYELQSLLGVAGRLPDYTHDFSHSNGALICRSSATSGAVTASFPFTVPSAQRLSWVTFTGRRAATAPLIELRVKKSCMNSTELNPTTTTLKMATPEIDADGFFTTHLSLNDDPPNNNDCAYWAEASFSVNTYKCTDGDAYLQKITVWQTIPDRIFRGSFHTNVTTGTP